jgi:hypothetical protein
MNAVATSLEWDHVAWDLLEISRFAESANPTWERWFDGYPIAIRQSCNSLSHLGHDSTRFMTENQQLFNDSCTDAAFGVVR